MSLIDDDGFKTLGVEFRQPLRVQKGLVSSNGANQAG